MDIVILKHLGTSKYQMKMDTLDAQYQVPTGFYEALGRMVWANPHRFGIRRIKRKTKVGGGSSQNGHIPPSLAAIKLDQLPKPRKSVKASSMKLLQDVVRPAPEGSLPRPFTRMIEATFDDESDITLGELRKMSQAELRRRFGPVKNFGEVKVMMMLHIVDHYGV